MGSDCDRRHERPEVTEILRKRKHPFLSQNGYGRSHVPFCARSQSCRPRRRCRKRGRTQYAKCATAELRTRGAHRSGRCRAEVAGCGRRRRHGQGRPNLTEATHRWSETALEVEGGAGSREGRKKGGPPKRNRCQRRPSARSGPALARAHTDTQGTSAAHGCDYTQTVGGNLMDVECCNWAST